MSFFSRLKSAGMDLLPAMALRPIHRRLIRRAVSVEQALLMDSFYGSLLPPNCLCFDVGANIGNRVFSFRRLGFRVVAVEPQPKCYSLLNASFGHDREVTLVNKAVGSAQAKAPMMLSDIHTVSSLSQAFIDATTQSGRFENITWNKTITVEVTTLDHLIAEYGIPDFIKIDVEGFESEVIRGLSRPVGLISLEWTPELTDTLIECVTTLSRLGPISCNLSWGERMTLARGEWMDRETLIEMIGQFREDNQLFGDVYIRSTAST